mmetsp:Transcript_23229/g.57603  ORF Transcript_23229/g.57603 Transcript_23229/m.57603 type:complete len:217 (+) Transcript_23229:166-816(+)
MRRGPRPPRPADPPRPIAVSSCLSLLSHGQSPSSPALYFSLSRYFHIYFFHNPFRPPALFPLVYFLVRHTLVANCTPYLYFRVSASTCKLKAAVVLAATSPETCMDTTGASFAPLMGNGDATTNLPLHMGWILVETAAEPETEASPFFTLYTHSTPAEVRRSTAMTHDALTVSISASDAARVCSSALTCAATAYFPSVPVRLSTTAETPSATSPAK